MSRINICVVFVFWCLLLMPNANSQTTERFSLAVLDLDANGVSQAEAKVVTGSIRYQIAQIINSPAFKTSSPEQYQIVERTQMERIFDEFEIQQTGCVSDSCALVFGRILKVDRIVIGSIGKVSETHTLSARIIDVESAETLNIAFTQRRGSIDDLLEYDVISLANELLGLDAGVVETTPRSLEKPRLTRRDSTKAPTFGLEISAGPIFMSGNTNNFIDHPLGLLIISNSVGYSGRIGLSVKQFASLILSFNRSQSEVSTEIDNYHIGDRGITYYQTNFQLYFLNNNKPQSKVVPFIQVEFFKYNPPSKINDEIVFSSGTSYGIGNKCYILKNLSMTFLLEWQMMDLKIGTPLSSYKYSEDLTMPVTQIYFSYHLPLL